MKRLLNGAWAGALALLLAVGGCGKSDGGNEVASAGGAAATPTTNASGDTAGAGDEDRMLKFAKCMREHGIDVPDPEPGGGVKVRAQAGDKAKMDAAQEACRQYAPGGKGGKVDPEMAEQARKFAQCMREHGVEEFPDPEGGGILINKSVADDPDFPEAQELCEKDRPGKGRAAS